MRRARSQSQLANQSSHSLEIVQCNLLGGPEPLDLISHTDGSVGGFLLEFGL
jgi:hypothetical protein